MDVPFIILRYAITTLLVFFWILEFVTYIADCVELSAAVPLLFMSAAQEHQ